MHRFVPGIVRRNGSTTVALVCLVFGLSAYVNLSWLSGPRSVELFPPFLEGVDLNHNRHMGGEYYMIAYAISKGKGFSNPFLAETGPTAWMPPLYCYLLALVIVMFRNRTYETLCVLLFKNLVLVFTGVLVCDVARATGRALRPGVCLGLYVVWLLDPGAQEVRRCWCCSPSASCVGNRSAITVEERC
jgi:hypothetical protein